MEGVNIGAVRRYSLAELEAIDFSSSDDFAVVVGNMKELLILKTNSDELWNEEHEQNLWQFVIDPESLIFLCYTVDQKLYSTFSVHDISVDEFFYFIKTSSEKLTSKDYDEKIIYGIATAPYFESFYEILCKVYFPFFIENTDWSKCIKVEYLQHQSKFLSQIFDLRNVLIGKLEFYVPRDILDHDVHFIAEKKEFLNEVERTVINWIWILMGMLIRRSHTDLGQNGGPIEEIEFWEKKCAALEKALQQLNRNDVQKCIEVLKEGKSGCFPKVISVHQQLLNETSVASENVKFLSILKKPCEIIKSAQRTDIPKHLNTLLNCVKVIWNNSNYFNRVSEISSLLTKVNNFVIDVCSKHIPLENIFTESDFEQEEILLDVIDCCKSWMHIFNVSEEAHKALAPKCWSVESVAPLINLFIHRCEELIQISEYKRQFKCDYKQDQFVKGHKCFEVAEQFGAIESYFLVLLKDLSNYKNSCLNIHTTMWYDHFKRFKDEVRELEMTVTKLMSSSFDNLAGIDEGIQILMMFKKYFEKEVAKRDFRKCIKSLYDVFFDEVSFVKKKLSESKRLSFPLLPTYGGVAFSLSQLPRGLKEQYKLLKSVSPLWTKDYIIDIDDPYQQVMDAITESIHTLFLQWVKTLPKDTNSWLRNSVIMKKETSYFIQLHIESHFLNLIEELHYWDKTNIEIPQSIVKLREKSDIHLKRILRVMLCVKNYNRTVLYLSENSDMFDDILTSLGEAVLPALFELNWSSPHATLIACLRGVAEHTKTVNDISGLYCDSNSKIGNICTKIGGKCLFTTNIKSSLVLSDFVQMQEHYRENVLKEIHLMLLDILQTAKKLLNTYKKKKADDELFSMKYIEMIGKQIADSFLESLLTSLKAISSLFGINRKNKIRTVLRIFLSLKDNQLYFSPSFKEVCCGIDDIIMNTISGLEGITKSEENFFENVPFKTKFKDIVDTSEYVKEVKLEIDYGLYKLFEAQNNYMVEWKPFSLLWDKDKSSILKDYAAKGWKASCFEDDMNELMKTAGKIPHIQRYRYLDFCVSDCSSLKETALACSEDWKNELGTIFSNNLSLNLQTAYDLIDLTSKKFLFTPKTLEELKVCLKFLNKSKTYSLDIQATFKPIHDLLLTLKKFGVQINKKVEYQEKYLGRNWKNLEKGFSEYYTTLQKVQALHHRYFMEYYGQLQKKSSSLVEYLHLKGPFQLKHGLTNALSKIYHFKKQLINLKEKEIWMKRDSKFFNISLDVLDVLKQIEKELDNLRIAWTYAKEIDSYMLEWASIFIPNFNVEEKKKVSDNYEKLIKDLKNKIEGNHWIILKELLLNIQQLEAYYAIILNFQEPTLKERHWESLKNVLDLSPSKTTEFFQTSEFSFKFLLNLTVDDLYEKTNLIAVQAKKEFEIEQNLKRMEDSWNAVTFNVTEWKTSYKLQDMENIVDVVKEHQTNLGIMKASKYVSYFGDKIDSFENSLSLILDAIEQAELFQNKFFYLENIFVEETIQAQLPKEFVEFQEVSLSWKGIAEFIEEEKVAWKISHKEGFLKELTLMNEKIQNVQKTLETYIESKRRSFPRFYFISDDDLLSIIGQNSPIDIQSHLKKCFASVNLLEMVESIEEKKNCREVIYKASGMHSICKEHVDFLNSVPLKGPVEAWMSDIEKMMCITLKELLPKCLQMLTKNLAKDTYNFTDIPWLNKWPGQICLLSFQIAWTAETVSTIKAVQESATIAPLKNLKRKWREILNQFIKKFASEAEALVQLKCMMIMISLVHITDVIDYLIKCVCNDPNAFEWMVQLRFFYDDYLEECFIHQTKAVFKYGFEYIGNRQKLVITPLTERCFISITTAFLLHQGALIKGPKVSGKSETLFELGKTLGNYVLAINCSEAFTHLSLIRILCGLAQIGAWGIFEGFNSLNVEVISILSQQINVIFRALSMKTDYYSFLGKENKLDEKCDIFLAVNTESNISNFSLPSSLLEVFRPVTMLSPDILVIIEVYFYIYGFQNSKSLSKDVLWIFKLAKEQLSVQYHYDFGLRAVISFLKLLGNVQRMFTGSSDVEIIVSSLKSFFGPILVLEDLQIFEAMLESVFGSVKEAIVKDYSHVQSSVKEALRQNSLQISSISVKQVLKFQEKKNIYHSIIHLGDSGSGKTTTWKTLKNALEIYHNENTKTSAVHEYILNPMAYSVKELFGHFKKDGGWIDGLFPSVLREACNNIQAREKWIILDGPVDMEWTNNLTSVLDKSKLLTLANGERLLVPDEVYLIIVTTNLKNCSPAAVSCCGIVYHQISNVSWELYFCSWLEKMENKFFSSLIKDLGDKYLEDIIEFSSKNLRDFKVLFISDIHFITSFCKLMGSLLKNIINDVHIEEKLSRIFWISITWSIGSMINESGQHVFNEFIHNLDETIPRNGSVYEFGINDNLDWIKWSDLLPTSWKLKEGIPLEKVIVPTKVTIAYQFLFESLLNDMNSIFLIGEMFSGKTSIVQELLHSLSPDSFKFTTLNVSCETTSAKFQNRVETQLLKKAGNIYLPGSGKKLIVFLDDLNLAFNKSYSAPYLELLNLELNCNFWYNREKWKMNHLQNVVFICAMTIQGCNEDNPLSKSLLNHFNIFNIISPSDLEIKTIFISLLMNKLTNPSLELRRLLNSISLGSLNVYKVITNIFLPTPSKLHYLFSIHSFKKVIFKLLEVNPSNRCNKMFMTKFWFHECLREFCDKLISRKDKSLFLQYLYEITGKEFLIQENLAEMDSFYFVKFLNPSDGYTEVKEIGELYAYIKKYLKDYERKHVNSPIILYENAVELLCHIIRGIEMPYGNMVLIGISGTGRQTLSRLAAFILNYQVFEIELRKQYGIRDFEHDLRNLLYTCGAKGLDVMFLLSEDKIIFDEFLQYVVDILSSGEISDLFRENELQKIYTEMMEDYGINKQTECHKIFTENVKKHLHIVFCLNYATEIYKKCIMNFPILFKYTSCDWFAEWPRVALECISQKLLEIYEFKLSIEGENVTCSQVLAEMHETMMKYSKDKKHSKMKIFHSSSTFIVFVKSFKSVYSKKLIQVEHDIERLQLGLTKINETQEKVNEIAKETAEAREKLVVATKECDEALLEIHAKQVIVGEKQATIQEKKIEIERNEKICKGIAIAAQEDLNAALPALEEARKALESLNKRDIGEIKSYPKPPVLVEMVLEAVMILRNSEPSWAEAKRQLGSPTFLKELIEFDKDNISDSALSKIGKYVRKPDFQPSIIGKVSVAAKSLCIWVHAIYLYGQIYKKVKPKKERLRKAQEELERLQKILADLLRELNELKAIIEQLEREHEFLLKKKEEYARTAAILALKLERAESIIQGLSSEKERWCTKFLALCEKKKYVTGDSFLSAGYLAYLGPHDPYIRNRTCSIWKRKITERNILFSPEFYLADFFMDEAGISEWTQCGLPNDQYSHEGAAIVTECYCCPFLVDPEGQAVKWLKNMEMKQGFKSCDFQDSKCISILENAILEGNSVLLQIKDEQVDPSLKSLLEKANGDLTIVFNDKELKVHKNFHLYISTKSSTAQFSQALMNKTCIINFTIKEKGLEDQLLPLVVRKERSDLEITKERLVKVIRESKKQLLEIENTILKLLSESQGSLLDDELLVDALKKSKTMSIVIEEKLQSSEKTETVIDAAREKYRPAALNAAILYFVLSGMTSVSSIYVFNLDSYISLFLDSISNSPKDSDVVRRIKKLKQYHQYATFKYACQSISEEHMLLLSFHMCVKILKTEGSIDKDEYDFFIHGEQAFESSTNQPNPYSQWLPQKCWDLIVQLESLPKFIGITVSFDEMSRNWLEWYQAAEPEKIFLPGNWRNVCNEFEKLLIIRCLRVDRITSCIRTFILNNLGRGFLEYPQVNLKDVVKESVANKPVIFFTLSVDIDLESVIAKLVHDFKMTEKYRALSLGQGQGIIATQLIIDAAKLGYWVFIFNCHLLVSWLQTLGKIVEKLQSIRVNPEFRLFLGSSPSKFFPASILHNSVVLTLDTSKGIRDSMLKIYSIDGLGEDYLKKGIKFRSLLFSLSFFHSIINERKKFQNLGWNINYFFTIADFKASIKMLEIYLKEYQDTPWDAFKTTIYDVCYRNHLMDERDTCILNTYYEQYFCDEVCSSMKFQLTSLETYYVPEDGPFESYIKYIKTLPPLDVAEVFGQHLNAEIPFRIQEGETMLECLSKIQGDTFKQKGDTSEIQIIKIIESLSQEVPNFIDEKDSKRVLQENPEPFSFILVQETKRYNELIKLVKNSLNNLFECLSGKQVLTKKVEDFLKCIQRFEVSSEWQTAYPSSKPLGSWLQDLKIRVQQFKDWSTTGIAPLKLWLPGFTSPNSVLNATLLAFAKNHDVTLKELEWEFHISTLEEVHIKEAPVEGIYVRGLFLEGAGWDKTNSILTEPEPLHLITAMPVIHFKPVIESSMRGLYTCPCYYTSKRNNKSGSTFLFNVDLKTKKPKEHWIKYGTALILSTD